MGIETSAFTLFYSFVLLHCDWSSCSRSAAPGFSSYWLCCRIPPWASC